MRDTGFILEREQAWVTRDLPSSTILQLFSFQKTIYSLELNGVIIRSKVLWFCDDNGTLVNFQERRGRAKMGKMVRVYLVCSGRESCETE